MAETLYTVSHVARMLGETEKWVHYVRKNHGAPEPSYEAQISGGPVPACLWNDTELDQWRAFHASQAWVPSVKIRRRKVDPYSDHKAVNHVRSRAITWKLWWHNSFEGPVWWFSTPQGWYNSNDDGRHWHLSGLDVRPEVFSYYAVNGTARPGGHVATILRSAANLRDMIERMMNLDESETP